MTAPATGPNRLRDLWLPIGPATVTNGQAADSPNVTGRVLDIRVSPDGRRAYTATAGGGVWYSRDEGASWLPLGAWISVEHPEQFDFFANSLASGSVVVDWDTSANGENDTVYVGTGEITPLREGRPGGRVAGVGILRAENPVGKTRLDPFAPVWAREGKAIEGFGIYRLAMRPGHPTDLVAAANGGLFVRTGPTGPDNWTRVTVEPFEDPHVITDVVWTALDHLYVAMEGKGIWRADAPNGPYEQVQLLGKVNKGRFALGSSSDGIATFALGEGPKLWRISSTVGIVVANVPADLFGTAEDRPGGEEDEEAGESEGHLETPEQAQIQAGYDMVVAVDPDRSDIVVLGGSTIGSDDAALFKCTVLDAPSATPKLDYDPAKNLKKGDDPNKVGPKFDPTYIGYGVHPDVHAITFAQRGGTTDLWVGCDGGIYRSTRGGRNYTWESRNNGLAVIEAGFVACHPGSDAVVVIGTQDNGVLQRVGDTVWRNELRGDGGGVAFDPAHTERYIGQSTNAGWRSNDGNVNQPVLRTGPSSPKDERDESGDASFYSSPGTIAATNASGSRLAIGTNRVWASEDFGHSWYTIPTGNDPRGKDAKGKQRRDTGQDRLFKDERAKTLACRWQDENALYVLNAESIQRFTRAPLTSKWTHGKAITAHHEKCGDYDEGDIDNQFKMPYLPPLGDWSDLAIHVPGPDGSSSLYVACTSLHGKLKMDTLWWYDGSGTWYSTRLRDAVQGPALAVVVHPTDSNTVFVGTSLGVWRGTFHPPAGGNNPGWDWVQFTNGLPEAVVQDLAFYREPAAGPPTMLLLRAALQSRGVWEVDLLAECDERTYLRAHDLDTRRRPTTSLVHPMRPHVSFDFYLSPDILIRPAPPVSPETAPPPPPGDFLPINANRNTHSFEFWTFQTAFHAIERACRPTGQWNKTFETLLVEYKSNHGLGVTPEINRNDWEFIVSADRVFTPPWNGEVPTEADFVQLVRDEAGTPGSFPAEYRLRRFKVDVLVHHRGLQQLQPLSVPVLLLMRAIPDVDITDTAAVNAAWGGLAIDDAWKSAAVTTLTTGHPPAGGWPDGWSVADTNHAVRFPEQNLDATRPQAATFDVVFTGNDEARHMLVAVCSSPTATVSAARLPGTTLFDLTLQSSHVAAHAIHLLRVQQP